MAITKVEVKGTIEEYQGRSDWKKADGTPYVFPIKYVTEADSYGTKEDAVSAGKWPDNADVYVLQAINKANVTAAKAAEYQKQIAEMKAAYEKTDDFLLAGFVKAALAMGMSQDRAEAMAKAALADAKANAK